jgi:2,3-dihydroxy-p-cumate/2,3-dihydroxybenzoate 3,4-dioxygenase
VIRYRHLARVVLNVRDVDASAAFYRDVVGLLPANDADASGCCLRAGSGGCDVVLARGEPGLKRLEFALESEPARDALAAALQRAGVSWREGDDGAVLRISEPHTGATIDFAIAQLVAPAPPMAPAPGLLRLGHVVLEAQDAMSAVHFFTDVLNFKVSDRIDGAITFLRCFPNPLHHSLGIGQGRNALHHVNFMTPHIDDVGRALWRLRRAGVTIVNGPGRHLPSGSLFLYFLDPDGLTLEFSAGMEEFPETGARAPRLLPREPMSFDLWDGPVDPRKGAIGAIEHDPR